MRRLASATRPLIVTVLVLAFAAAAGVAASDFGAARLAIGLLGRDAEVWRGFATGHPVLALAAFVGAYAAALFFFVPVALILTFASGFLFLPAIGAGASVAGACLGASLSYALARFGLSGAGRRGRALAWAGSSQLLDVLRARVFQITLSVRLLPLTPFTLFSLAAGGVNAAFWPFFAGTAPGVLPECGAYALLGRRLGAMVTAGGVIDARDLVQPWLLVPLAMLAAACFGSLALDPGADRRRSSSPVLVAAAIVDP